MNWTTHFSYLHEEPSIIWHLAVGMLVGLCFAGGLYIILRNKGGRPHLLLSIPLFLLLIGYVTGSARLSEYNFLLSHIGKNGPATVIEGKWDSHLEGTEMRLVVGNAQLTRPWKHYHAGCLSKPMYIFLSKKHQRETLRISYTVLPEEDPKARSESEYINTDYICIIEVMTGK